MYEQIQIMTGLPEELKWINAILLIVFYVMDLVVICEIIGNLFKIIK